ncbi:MULTISPECIES: ATP-binding protein [unclassified Blastococcus]|uniref:ATP-binding protein n=1 Tax=unclassified Blastococcus TaxID=2619396 RepID=UPI000DE9C4F4|nr:MULTISPECIES: ATP-binding protein [unclassified Blastococcus]RBY91916.1 ATP-binding protein [Blastococcus sp. TF02-8]TFV51555.1 ATP-binding protein [Blastococcus sp. TF02A_35]
MSDVLWAQRPVPTVGSDAVHVSHWAPTTLLDLSYSRRELAASLQDADRRWAAASVAQGAEERLLLCVEELGSNALRHGRAPVLMDLTAFDHHWLLVVSDAAAETPPVPAMDRDAAAGGLGLYLVARICGAHGWTTHRRRKVVWVRIDYTLTEPPPEVVDRLPRPPLEATRCNLSAASSLRKRD